MAKKQENSVKPVEAAPEAASPMEEVFAGTAGGPHVGLASASGDGVIETATSATKAFELFQDKFLDNRTREINEFLRQDLSREEYVARTQLLEEAGIQGDEAYSGLGPLSPSDRVQNKKSTKPAADLMETPIQKVHRLQGELADMTNTLTSFLRSRNAEISDTNEVINLPEDTAAEARILFGADPAALLLELQSLKRTVEQTMQSEGYEALIKSLDAVPGSDAEVLPASSSAELMHNKHYVEHLVRRLDEVTLDITKKSSQPAPNKKENPSDGYVTYEIYEDSTAASGGAGSALDSARVFDLERRIAHVETALGVESSATFGMPFDNITEAINDIVNRLSALHPSHVDGLSRRLPGLTAQLDDLLSRTERLVQKQRQTDINPEVSSNADAQTISKLYDLVEATRPASAALPVLVERLRLLKTLHQEASSVVSRLDGTQIFILHAALEQQQDDLAALLETTEAGFKELQASMAHNLEWAREIMMSLNPASTAATNATNAAISVSHK